MRVALAPLATWKRRRPRLRAPCPGRPRVGGGASVVLLYPEFVLRTAPYVAGKVSAKLPSREALIPKIKPPPRDGA